MRVLKNVSRTNIKTNFRGRIIELKGKKCLILKNYDTDEEDRALYEYIKGTWGFVIDITKQVIDAKEKLKIKNKK